MELLAVAVTDTDYYTPDFLLNLGSLPKQFPVFGGFMWGALTVYSIQLAQKLRWDKMWTALVAGMFIVTALPPESPFLQGWECQFLLNGEHLRILAAFRIYLEPKNNYPAALAMKPA